MSRIIIHIDLNAFFVRCEEIKDPSLEGKPVIIGHKGRGGIISTCSYAARKYGVHSGMPTFKALELCPEAIIIPGNHRYYWEMSKKFFKFIKQYCRKIEKASVDECYLDMSDELKDIKNVSQYLKDMQNKLFEETGLKCSIGVAPTKFLAKMASDLKKPMGLTIIRRKDARKMLANLPIEDFFGIGKKTAPKLRSLGVNTIGDLGERIDKENPIIKHELGKFYFVIKDWINGYGNDIVETEPFDPKSIGTSHTLSCDTNSFLDLKENISMLAQDVSERAKEQDKVGTTVQLVLKDNNFKVLNRSISFRKPTNEYADIFSYALGLLERNYDDSRMVRLVGVTLQNLVDPRDIVVQLSIFDNYEEIKEECATKLLISDLNRQMNKTVFTTVGELSREKKHGNK